MVNDIKIEEYNREPIYYCKRCLSLKILTIPNCENSDYCDDCGSTDIDNCCIDEWENMYKKINGYSFLNRDNKYGRDKKS